MLILSKKHQIIKLYLECKIKRSGLVKTILMRKVFMHYKSDDMYTVFGKWDGNCICK